MLHFQQFLIVVTVLCLGSLLPNVKCSQEETGHFQVQNEKEGDLKVHATKDSAQIETQASSVRVILEPGLVKIPAIKKIEGKETDDENKKDEKVRKIIKIETPIYLGLRRSKINKKLKDPAHQTLEKVHRAFNQGKRTFENSIMLENWKNENRHYIRKNLKRVKKSNGISKITIKKIRREDIPSRKSDIDREMRVHGKTGGLRIKTGKHGTKLVSSSGDLNVFIRNPSEPDDENNPSDSNSDRRSPLADSKYHVTDPNYHVINSNYHLISSDMEGLSLKKDNVPELKIECTTPPCPA